VPQVAAMATRATEVEGLAVVIGLQSTGEANTKQAMALVGSARCCPQPHRPSFRPSFLD
jgi:hypothetical protein